MKRLFSLLLAFIIILSLCACEGNWESVNLKDPIGIPENGVIKANVIEQVKQENAIAVFTGKSGDYKYEWTIFGSDVSEPKEINLGVQISKTDDGHIKVTLNQTEAFGFSALLSVYLNEQWKAQSATAFANDQAVASVSLTGSKTTILNTTLDGSVSNLVVHPDELPKDAYTPETEPPTEAPSVPAVSNGEKDDYLSKPGESDDKVYKDKYNTDPVQRANPNR